MEHQKIRIEIEAGHQLIIQAHIHIYQIQEV